MWMRSVRIDGEEIGGVPCIDDLRQRIGVIPFPASGLHLTESPIEPTVADGGTGLPVAVTMVAPVGLEGAERGQSQAYSLSAAERSHLQDTWRRVVWQPVDASTTVDGLHVLPSPQADSSG